MQEYYDKSFVFNHLEDLILLPIPFKTSNLSHEEFDKRWKESNAVLSHVQKTLKKFQNELAFRSKLFLEIRKSYPQFCTSFKSALSEEDYQKYLSILKQTKLDVMSILSSRRLTTGSYEQELLARKDVVSSIIDCESTNRLSFLEDKFVLDELNRIGSFNLNSETLHDIESLSKELQERIKQYQLYAKLYNTESNEIRIEIDR